MQRFEYDAVVVGAGPNGLTAAVVLARAGLSVLVLEAHEEIGGGCRTSELTLPGFQHDVCAAVHPMGALSPAFREIGLEQHGVEWAHAPVPLAHPLPNGRAALLHRSLERTIENLGADGERWRRLFEKILEDAGGFFAEILKPIRVPRSPLTMARFGLNALRPAESVLHRFKTDEAKALFAGCAAHSILPLDQLGTAAFGLVLVLSAHAIGWPVTRGGSRRIVYALNECLVQAGGKVQCGVPVRSISEIPTSRVVLFDLTPRQVADIAVDALPERYRRRLLKFEYGPGVFKVDWALDGPIPWTNPDCSMASTVHVCGTADELLRSESLLRTAPPEQPFVLVAQQSLFDSSRAPGTQHTGWAYCHVPSGCTVDMTERIENQIERFAPGFRDCILARRCISPKQYEAYNMNFIGGDIGGGANTLRQFLFRPFPRWNPYTTPNKRLYICSSSTPPGGGVHGMSGYWAAKTALRSAFGKSE